MERLHSLNLNLILNLPNDESIGRGFPPLRAKVVNEFLRQHLLALVGDRHPTSSPDGLQLAEEYLTRQFQSLELIVTVHSFAAIGGTYRNIVGTLPAMEGISAPPLVVAAHYDTVAHSPGADDNASGLAVMLEAARRLRTAPLRRPVRFIAFCLEEAQLLGSLAYAAQLRERGETLCGAIVLECVGYASARSASQHVPPGLPIAIPSVGDFLGIIGNQDSAGLAETIERAAKHSVQDLNTFSLIVPGQGELFPDTRRSDHAAFWAHGYPAVMLTDTANFRNPHYHQPTDIIETLDLEFMEKVTRLLVAAVSEMATATD